MRNQIKTPFFAPPSRYVGDKYPRTLQEAFGPYTSPLVDHAARARAMRRMFLAGALASAAGFALLCVLLARSWS